MMWGALFAVTRHEGLMMPCGLSFSVKRGRLAEKLIRRGNGN